MSAVAPPVPLSVGAIDAAWLGAALRFAGHDVEVTACEHVAVVGGNATKVRLRATYAGGAAGLPGELCVKVGMELQDPSQNLTGSSYDVEGRFYRDVRPVLGPMSVPRCVAIVIEAATSVCALVMEDLIAAGARFGDPRRDVLSEAQLRTLLSSLARLHVGWWEHRPPEMLADLDRGIDLSNRLGRYYGTFDTAYVAERIDRAGPALPPRLCHPSLLVDRFWALADRAQHQSMALIHADPHLANIFIRSDGTVGIADWQTMRWGRWAHDVSYLIGSSLPIDERRRLEVGLLDHYLTELDGLAGVTPHRGDAERAYAESMVYGLFGWLTAPAYFGYPPDFTGVYVERFGAAVLDAGALDLLAAP